MSFGYFMWWDKEECIKHVGWIWCYDGGLEEKHLWLFELWAELAAFFIEFFFYLKEQQINYSYSHLFIYLVDISLKMN